VYLPRAPPAVIEIKFQIDIALSCQPHRLHRLLTQKSSPQIGVQDNPGSIDYRLKTGLTQVLSLLANRFHHFTEGRARIAQSDGVANLVKTLPYQMQNCSVRIALLKLHDLLVSEQLIYTRNTTELVLHLDNHSITFVRNLRGYSRTYQLPCYNANATMELKQLRTFCAVADKKSFSRAAEAVGLTQPTVSFQISSLETELGTRLFERGGRETRFTESGKTLYQYARSILSLAEEAEQALGQLKGLAKGSLIIGASTIPGEYILPGLLQKFREQFPGIEATLVIADTRGIIKKVMDNEVELGAVGARERNDKLTFTTFATDRLVLIASNDSRWLKGDSITAEKLKGLPFIQRESGSGTRTIATQRLEELGLKEDALNVVLTLGSTAAVREAVGRGAGVSIISRRAIENETKLGLIKEVTVRGLELSRDFFLVHRRQKTLSPAATAFLQFLEEQKGSM